MMLLHRAYAMLLFLKILSLTSGINVDNSFTCSPNEIMSQTKVICPMVPTGKLPEQTRSLQVKGNVKSLKKEMFENMTQLEDLTLSNCNISEVESLTFSAMVKLKTLWLSNNTIDFITEDIFSNLTSLQELHLDGNGIKVIMDGSFKYLESLKILNLANNKLLEIPGELPPTLYQFILNNNGIERVPTEKLSNLIQLHELNVCGNEISMLPAVDIAPNLMILCIGDKVERSTTRGSKAPKLENLHVSGRLINSTNKSGSLGDSLKSFTNLKNLEIESYELNSFEFLENMSSLSALTLENINYTQHGITWFPENLTYLSISASSSLAHQLLNDKHNMTQLKVLRLQNNSLTIINKLQSEHLLKTVEILDIKYNPLNCTPEKWSWLQQKIREHKKFLSDVECLVCNEPKEAKYNRFIDIVNLQDGTDIDKPHEIKTENVTGNYMVNEPRETNKQIMIYGFLIFIAILIVFFIMLKLCHKVILIYHGRTSSEQRERNGDSKLENRPVESSSSGCADFKIKLVRYSKHLTSEDYNNYDTLSAKRMYNTDQDTASKKMCNTSTTLNVSENTKL